MTLSVPSTSLKEARLHTRRIARTHYENFTVVSLVLPRKLRQDFYNIYAFCRHADDLADEIESSEESLRRLNGLREDVRRIYDNEQPHESILVALSETIRQYDIPPTPFLALIDAFEQDRRIGRYETYASVLDYCTRSANPVGHLVLYLCGYRDTERQRLSDFTCTALQLTNFWQDVVSDLEVRDRIYIPLEDMRRFGVTEEDIRARRATPQFIELMRFEVDRAEDLFKAGEALLPLIDRKHRTDIALYGRGGRAILERIRGVGYNVLARRPTLGKWAKLALLARVLLRIPQREMTNAPAISLNDSYAYCHELMRTAARNFYFGMSMLPEAKRQAMHALYGFMRLIDDIADASLPSSSPSPGTPGEGWGEGVIGKRALLESWRSDMHAATTGRFANHPIWPAFADTVRRFSIPTKIFDDAIDGQIQDLFQNTYATFKDLYQYCYRVASTVGIAAVHIWGYRDDSALKLAEERGIAMQLTNILRDIREDAARGRSYLPTEDRRQFGCEIWDPASGDPAPAGFEDLLRFESNRARQYYEQSSHLEDLITPDARPTLQIMTDIYSGILDRITAHPRVVLLKRVSLSTFEKLTVVLRHRWKSEMEAIEGTG